MATKKVARSYKRSTMPPAEPASERRLRAAPSVAKDIVIEVISEDECPVDTQVQLVELIADGERVRMNPTQVIEAYQALRRHVHGVRDVEAVLSKIRGVRNEATDLIAVVRKELAELWWYADRTLGGESGVSANVARDEIAYLMCTLGFDLNQLGGHVVELSDHADGQVNGAHHG
jgi:hypothetical protein